MNVDQAQFTFSGRIHTDFQGYSKLLAFYNYCIKYSNCCIVLNWDHLEILDANLSALLCAMIHKLKKTNKLTFYLDVSSLKGGLSVFWRNGFASYILKSKNEIVDDRQSTIQLKAFRVTGSDNYCSYIENELLKHRGIDLMRFKDKGKVKDSYLELFNNYEIHSETTEPVICCGQFFPNAGELKFSMVDLGCGFFKKISNFTKDDQFPITKAVDAIQWAIRGGSTKEEAAGGTGLKKMLSYCMSSRSSIQIISDNSFWAYDQSISDYKIEQPFCGTMINLIMRYS